MFVKRRLHQTAATSPWASAASSASRSLNGTTRVVSAGSTWAPIEPGRAIDLAGGVEDRQRLVDRPVVAPVHHADLRAAGEVAGEAQHEAVGVGRRHRHLPAREPEPPGELAGDPRRVGGREHRRDAPLGLAGDRVGHLGERVAGHRAGVAEAEVDELVAVDIGAPRPVGLGDEQREGARPAGHPRHRHAGEQVLAGVGGELRRPRMQLDETLLLLRVQVSQPTPVVAPELSASFGPWLRFKQTVR